MAGTEIVERHGKAFEAEARQHGGGRIQVVHRDAFGDFQADAAPGHGHAFAQCSHAVGEIGVAQVAAGNVDADLHWRRRASASRR